MTRRHYILALLILAAPANHRPAQSEAPWLRGVAAVYRMLSETETVSDAVFDDVAARRRTTSFGAVALSRDDATRLTPGSFTALARRNPTAGMAREDRDRLDRNLWGFINTQASEREVKHLDRQWGAEGKSRPRTVAKDVAHVESCRQCRSIYHKVTRHTKLRCQSEKIGFKAPFPEDIDAKSTIPP